MSYLDAEYDDINTSITLIGEDFDFERVPEFQASLGVSKEFFIDAFGTIVLRADYSHRSKTFNDAFNTPVLETGAVDLLDASVRWSNPAGDWSVTFAARNLTDEEYLITGVYGTAFQVFEGTFDRGRQWRVELRKDF